MSTAMSKAIELGVNIDHAATIRQARFTSYPDLVKLVEIVEQAGADGITLHLREDRRHIQDADVHTLRRTITTKMNLEMAATDEMIAIAGEVRPDDVCVVPERREELTTEGGLDVIGHRAQIEKLCRELGDAGIRVSIFIEPDREQIAAAADCGAPVIELHTGAYANRDGAEREAELARLRDAAEFALDRGLVVNAGHGLDYDNVAPICALPGINELNIGHSIIARALFVGIDEAVKEMRALLQR